MNSSVGLLPFPSTTDLIWAAPEDCLCAFDPADPDFDAKAVFPVSSITIVAPDLLCPVGQTVRGVAGGATTANGTYVETLMSDGTIQRSAPNYNGAYCAAAATSERPVVITEKYIFDNTQVTKRVSKTSPTEALYLFYEGGKLVHKVRRSSVGAAFNYSAAEPDIREDGRVFWQGALQTQSSDANWDYFIYSFAGSFVA